MTPPPASSNTPSHSDSRLRVDSEDDLFEGIDWREVYTRLCRGLTATLGFMVLGVAVAATAYVVTSGFISTRTSMRITFAFNGFGKGEYPDHSKFQPDDLRAPDVVVEALRRQGLDVSEDFQSKVRAALTIEGIIPPSIIKERDRLRAAGQTPATFIPDEYLVTLTLPGKFPLSGGQRELLLNAIVGAYQEKFQRTYASIPLNFGNAFESLHRADFYEYELILSSEIQNLISYLNQQLDQAKTFRSPTTNLSFSDLLSQTELFSQIRLNETLGLIRQNGLSMNRANAIIRMDYYLRTLTNEEQKAIEEEKVVDDLLAKSQERSQNYVLGIKTQVTQQRSESPILDQGLIDSLLANDAYNFLVHQALNAGLAVKRIQAEKAQLLERRKDMERFLNDTGDQSAVVANVQRSLTDLEVSYKELVSNIRQTHADYVRQQFADVIHISMQPVTDNRYLPLVVAGAIGGFIGLAIGIGLSLLEIYVSGKRDLR